MTGKKIENELRARGVRVVDLTSSLGIAERSTVYKWFRGERLPSLDTMYELSRFLDVPMDELIVAG